MAAWKGSLAFLLIINLGIAFAQNCPTDAAKEKVGVAVLIDTSSSEGSAAGRMQQVFSMVGTLLSVALSKNFFCHYAFEIKCKSFDQTSGQDEFVASTSDVEDQMEFFQEITPQLRAFTENLAINEGSVTDISSAIREARKTEFSSAVDKKILIIISDFVVTVKPGHLPGSVAMATDAGFKILPVLIDAMPVNEVVWKSLSATRLDMRAEDDNLQDDITSALAKIGVAPEEPDMGDMSGDVSGDGEGGYE